MKRIVIDLDGTLTHDESNIPYAEKRINTEVVGKLREYKNKGFYIIVATARNMQTYSGNLGKINANTVPNVVEWLDRHQVPYDELHVGKPWCGLSGFYVDDKALRPDEFARLNYSEIQLLLGLQKESE